MNVKSCRCPFRVKRNHRDRIFQRRCKSRKNDYCLVITAMCCELQLRTYFCLIVYNIRYDGYALLTKCKRN